MNRRFLILGLCLFLGATSVSGAPPQPPPLAPQAPVLPGSALDTLNQLINQAGDMGLTSKLGLPGGNGGGPGEPAEGDAAPSVDNLPYKNSLMFDETQLDQLYNAMAGFTTVESGGKQIAAQIQDKITVDAEGKVFDTAGNLLGRINDENVFVDTDGNVLGRVEKGGVVVDNEGNYLGRDKRVKAKVYPTVAPSFYLNSVMFYMPKNWSVWLNHRRIRFGTKMNGLTILNISEDYVDMLWKPMDLDFIAPDWRKKLLPVGEGISKDLGVPFTKDQLANIQKELKSAQDAAEQAAKKALMEAAALERMKQLKIEPPKEPDTITPTEGANADVVARMKQLRLASPATSPENNSSSTPAVPAMPVPAAALPQIGIQPSLPAPGESADTDTVKPAPLSPSSVPQVSFDLPDLGALGVDPKTGEIKLDTTKLAKELKTVEQKNQEEENKIKQAEEEKRMKIEEEKLKKKAEIEKQKHIALYANQEVDEADYKWEYKSPDGMILVDPVKKLVKFRLGLNQSFVSRTFGLEEGYVASTALVSPEGAQNAVPVAAGALEQQIFDYSNVPQQSVINSSIINQPGGRPPGLGSTFPPGTAPGMGQNFAPPGGPNFAPGGGQSFAPGGVPNLTPGGAPNYAPGGTPKVVTPQSPGKPPTMLPPGAAINPYVKTQAMPAVTP
jgi:hypothetical protein